MTVLTLVDILRIQDFVFLSNRLKDIIGGSAIVEKAVGEFINQALGDGEAIVQAGGNALLMFSTLEDAKTFASRYTEKLIDDAPGLQAAIVHQLLDGMEFHDAFLKLHEQMRKRKGRNAPLVPCVGYGITESCRGTGLPASILTKHEEDALFGELTPVSTVLQKRRAVELISAEDKRWENLLPDVFQRSFSQGDGPELHLTIPKNLERLGRTRGVESLMAVVHIDGNDVGSKLGGLHRCWADEDIEIEEIKCRMKEVSGSIKDLGNSAMKSCFTRIREGITYDSGSNSAGYLVSGNPPSRSIALHQDDSDLFLPLRPVILGGDDITFVCDARIGHDMADTALRQFERVEIPYLGKLTACAGIAIAGIRSPFSQVYARSEELCRIAKRFRRESNVDSSFIDWHFDTGVTMSSVERIRNNEFRPIQGSAITKYALTCRPYPLGNPKQIVRGTWTWLANQILLGDSGLLRGTWLEHKTQLYDLGSILSQERDLNNARILVERELERWKIIDRQLVFPGETNSILLDGQTPVLDAIELCRLYVNLEREMQ